MSTCGSVEKDCESKAHSGNRLNAEKSGTKARDNSDCTSIFND